MHLEHWPLGQLACEAEPADPEDDPVGLLDPAEPPDDAAHRRRPRAVLPLEVPQQEPPVPQVLLPEQPPE